MKGNPENQMKNFGDGAVYFGWLSTLVGLIAITGDRFLVWGDIKKIGPALTVSMLPILYGYTARLISLALSRDLSPMTHTLHTAIFLTLFSQTA